MNQEEKDKLRVVILYSAGHLGSSVALNLLSKMPEINIVGIVRGDPAPLTIKGIIKSLKRTRKTGLSFGFLLAWQRFMQFLIFYLVAPIFNREHLKSGWQISKSLGIPSFSTDNVNSDATENFIKTINPDLIISVYFSQILKKNILDIPNVGSINLHPGILPEYKGAFVYFWALKNHEKQTGVTIHWMDEGVDTGKIITKKKFDINETDTQQQVVVKSAICGARQLQQVFRLIENKQKVEIASDVEANPDNSYYKFPEKPDYREYRRKRRFFRARNIFYLVLRRPIKKLLLLKLRKRF